jgi:glucosamine kinase
VLGRAISGGGSPTHNADAREHVRAAITEALARARVEPASVISLVGGMAGLEDDSDLGWAQEFVSIDGLGCPRQLVNDTVVAQVGAFAGGPGIIVVAGTGSLILAINEAGEHIRNDRYQHYAGGARHLSFHAMARILVGEDTEADVPFIRQVFEYWNVADKRALRRRVLGLEEVDRNDVKRLYGRMAPLVTECAELSPLASESCWWLIRSTCVGARLLAGDFAADTVRVGLEGGLATCRTFASRIRSELAESTQDRVQVVPAILDPAAGAALMALQQVGIDPDESIVERLAASNRPTS